MDRESILNRSSAFVSPVRRSIHNSRDYIELSDSARQVFMYLLTTPLAIQCSGIIPVSRLGILAGLHWKVERYGELEAAIEEIADSELACFDEVSDVVFIPEAVVMNPPKNKNIICGWAKRSQEIEECELKRMWVKCVHDVVEALYPTHLGAFCEQFRYYEEIKVVDEDDGDCENVENINDYSGKRTSCDSSGNTLGNTSPNTSTKCSINTLSNTNRECSEEREEEEETEREKEKETEEEVSKKSTPPLSLSSLSVSERVKGYRRKYIAFLKEIGITKRQAATWKKIDKDKCIQLADAYGDELFPDVLREFVVTFPEMKKEKKWTGSPTLALLFAWKDLYFNTAVVERHEEERKQHESFSGFGEEWENKNVQ